MAGLALILTSRGLLHGRRNAWLVALVAAAASVPGHHLKDADLVGLTATAGTITTLLLWWRAFSARSDPALARRGLQVLLIGEAAAFTYGAVALYALDAEFRRPTTIWQAVLNAGRLMFLLSTNLEPVSRHGRWLIDSVRVAALVVALTALGRIVATVAAHPLQRERQSPVIARLLGTYASNDLAYFQLLDDKIWFIGADDQAFIGYKLVGTVALALGDPIGAPTSVTATTEGFVELCERNGWAPAFHQVTDRGAATLRGAGLRALKIGEDAVVDLRAWDLTGHSFKALRSALRRVERAGCKLVTLNPPLDDDTVEALRVVSDAWLADGHHRERTFTLGRFDPAQVRECTVIAVEQHANDGAPARLVAFANLVPSYKSPNGNFDLMRRRPDAPNGVMDYLFVGLIDHFRAEERDGMNLGLAPASGIEGDTLPDRALRLLYEHGGAAFNFEGLRAFKDKWHPRWEPRYLAYRSDADLLRVASAVARAGELPEANALKARVTSLGRRYPFTAAVVLVVAWLMAVTAIDRDTYQELARHLALRWGDLTHLQLWRLLTAQLLQTKPGWQLATLVAAATVIPLAERRFGSLRAILLFFVGDALSRLVTLAALWVAASFGYRPALDALAARHSGTTSAQWAMAAALAWTMPRGKLRTTILVGEGLLLIGSLAWSHRLFDLQHLLAAIAGVAVVVSSGRLRALQPG